MIYNIIFSYYVHNVYSKLYIIYVSLKCINVGMHVCTWIKSSSINIDIEEIIRLYTSESINVKYSYS